jgi:hypothetical protein
MREASMERKKHIDYYVCAAHAHALERNEFLCKQQQQRAIAIVAFIVHSFFCHSSVLSCTQKEMTLLQFLNFLFSSRER